MQKIDVSAFDMAGMEVFAGLQIPKTEKFVQQTAATVKTYAKRERILHAYRENSHIGILLRGKAQTIAEDWLGNETVGESLERGSLLGVTSAILSAEYNDSSAEAGATPEQLAGIRLKLREAQWYWDWVAAENGNGFHNADKCMRISGEAIDLAHQVIEDANAVIKGAL